MMTLGLGVQCASAFSLLGPPPATPSDPDGYQQSDIGYQLPGDIGTPKNLGEEYRWNTKTLVYAFDTAFLDYFGSNGVFAVEQAIEIFNSLTNFTSYSQELDEFPLEAKRDNYRASALGLADLKSFALSMMVEELGLADPDRFTWAMRWREALPGLSCPFMHYDVIKRNFDPVTYEPSSYVNGTLYSYQIIEYCSQVIPLADAYEFPVDPLANTATAVAAFGMGLGQFYTGLTRDDIGGFRYMLRTNNMNFESVSLDSELLRTNSSSQLLATSNLALLVAQSITNDAAALQALYPGLIISSTTPVFTNVVTTNIIAYFTNFPWAAPTDAAAFVVSSTRTTNVATWYAHVVDNIRIGPHYNNGPLNLFNNAWPSTNGIIYMQTNSVGPGACDAWEPPGRICTNQSKLKVVTTRAITGDYFITPTNACGFSIIHTQLVTTVGVTNTITSATTNAATTTNVNQQVTLNYVSFFTNRYFIIRTVDCLTNTVALRQGMDTFKFIRANYDSLLGRFFQPVTNTYSLIAISNSTPYLEVFQRVVVRPDFLFQAEERMVPGGAWHAFGFRTAPGRGTGYVVANIQNPTAVDGPGTREPFIEISFNKVGPMIINQGPFLMSETDFLFNSFVWGSFDASTNAPVVYPSYRSITDLENQVLIQITPSGPVLADATAGSGYSVTFAAMGGQPPYSWSVSPASPALPDGLFFNSSGTLSGVPTAEGTYDFVLRLSDSGARSVDRNYTITVNAP